MKVLITGGNGQLGYDMALLLSKHGVDHLAIDIEDCDLTNKAQVFDTFLSYAPTCVVHCAAYTAVDKAESNQDACTAVNVEATRNIAEVCKQLGAKMVYISTDYVFHGDGDAPLEVDDAKHPLSVYGQTKYEGEKVVQALLTDCYIVRTSWVFGIHGHNFVKTMLKLGESKEQLTVVADQIGSPTYTPDLAVFLWELIQTDKYGVYHATNDGFCSWCEFAKKIMEIGNRPCVVLPISSDEYPVPAKRPLNSRLSKQSIMDANLSLLPTWQDALERYISVLLDESEKGE